MNQTISKNWDETSRMLAGKGARVLMACRNAARGTEALKAIRAIHDEAKLDLYLLDLADLESVAELPAALRENGISRLDVLVNNAGIMMPPKRQTTKQGFEAQFGINHLGHFALTRSLFEIGRAS